ncbi:oxidoreductase- short chain dehydrogenase/reductase family [Apiospora arundinis]
MESVKHFHFPPASGANFTQKLHQKVPPALDPIAQPLAHGFVAAITGASQGLGRATAEVFARAGATGLILSARTLAGLEETRRICEEAHSDSKKPADHTNLKITLVVGSVGTEADAKKLADAVRDEHEGRLDMLINNAGVVSTHESAWGPLDQIRPDQLEVPMQTNYIGRFLTMQALMLALLASPSGGTVVNVTSICSHFTAAGLGALGFNISALASNRLTEMAAEVYRTDGTEGGGGGKGPVFYSVHPGTIFTNPRPGWLNGRYISATWDLEELQERKAEIVEGDKLKSRMVL